MTAGFLEIFIVLAIAPLVAYLPNAAMAGILFIVAWGLIDIPAIKHIFASTHSERSIFLVTFLSALFLDLEFAIMAGILLSLMLYLMRVSGRASSARVPDPHLPNRKFSSEGGHLQECPQLHIMRIDGSLFFGSVAYIREKFARLEQQHPRAETPRHRRPGHQLRRHRRRRRAGQRGGAAARRGRRTLPDQRQAGSVGVAGAVPRHGQDRHPTTSSRASRPRCAPSSRNWTSRSAATARRAPSSSARPYPTPATANRRRFTCNRPAPDRSPERNPMTVSQRAPDPRAGTVAPDSGSGNVRLKPVAPDRSTQRTRATGPERSARPDNTDPVRPTSPFRGNARKRLRRYFRVIQRKFFSRLAWKVRLVFWGGAVLVGGLCALFALLADRADQLFHRLLALGPWVAAGGHAAGDGRLAWATRNLFPGSQGSGIPQAIAALESRRKGLSVLSLRIAVGKILLTLAGLMVGASIGREGPIGAHRRIHHVFARPLCAVSRALHGARPDPRPAAPPASPRRSTRRSPASCSPSRK